MTDARVNLWGRTIGAVTWDQERSLGYFQFTPEFSRSGIEVAPLSMPLRQDTCSFPALPRETFLGLPGLLVDSLPDKYGHRLIDAWLAAQGRTPQSFNPVERLCYVGKRGMGALEFSPTVRGTQVQHKARLEVSRLVALANRVLAQRESLDGAFDGENNQEMIEEILRVGASAGGARAKALLAWNPTTNEFKSGQLGLDPGYQHWLMKFDGVAGNRDKETADPEGYGLIEYAYSRMAKKAGVEMTDCRLHHEGGRSHFMTRRFDRTDSGVKMHMQTLAAMAHYDYNDPLSYSYEQAVQVMRRLDLPLVQIEQQFRRAVFNVVARNQDDHVKNIAFLMNKKGEWHLSPAYDVIYAWNPGGDWTGKHQMSINGKRDGFVRDDILSFAQHADIKTAKATEIIDEVVEAVRQWPEFAEQAGVEPGRVSAIGKAHRLNL